MIDDQRIQEGLAEAEDVIDISHEGLAELEQIENYLALHGADQELLHYVSRTRRTAEEVLEDAYDAREQYRILQQMKEAENNE